MARDDFMEFDESKFDPGNITEENLTEEMKRDFIDYSMSVIVSRALPDVRDGLKPVQRRILFAMNEMNNTPDKPYRKCARIVGETMGKYHPHGDSSIYGALVYMAQSWNMREMLIIGHAVNLVMGFLSIVVHGVRLNIMEFSGQVGVEWSGYKYEPFKKKVLK